MLTRSILLALMLGCFTVSASAFQNDSQSIQEKAASIAPAKVAIKADEKKLNVTIDGELFTTFDHTTYTKPILYPILSPGQIRMTRDWPMKKDTEGESHDHPHHKSMWISHEINGINFWAEKGGSVKTEKIETAFKGNPKNVLRATSVWIKESDGKIQLTDQTTYWFGGDKMSRWINCLIEYQATHGDVHMDDTKEGVFAIRTHPDLRVSANRKKGVEEVFGNALNSQGVRGKAVWGKPSKWMLYYGKIDGKPASIAMYDHPTNLRHPTTWHARDYGLVAANPFGMHHFLGKEKGAGAVNIESGDSLQLRYRVEFFNSIVTAELIEEKFQAFAKEPLSELEVEKK